MSDMLEKSSTFVLHLPVTDWTQKKSFLPLRIIIMLKLCSSGNKFNAQLSSPPCLLPHAAVLLCTYFFTVKGNGALRDTRDVNYELWRAKKVASLLEERKISVCNCACADECARVNGQNCNTIHRSKSEGDTKYISGIEPGFTFRRFLQTKLSKKFVRSSGGYIQNYFEVMQIIK